MSRKEAVRDFAEYSECQVRTEKNGDQNAQTWWYTPVIPALEVEIGKSEVHCHSELKASLGVIRVCLK